MWTDIVRSSLTSCDAYLMPPCQDYMDRRRIFTVDPAYFPINRMREIVNYLHSHDQHFGEQQSLRRFPLSLIYIFGASTDDGPGCGISSWPRLRTVRSGYRGRYLAQERERESASWTRMAWCAIINSRAAGD